MSASKHNTCNLAGVCKCPHPRSSSGPTQHISGGFCPCKVLRSFLTAFLPVTLFDPCSHFWDTKGRQTFLFPSCQWINWEPEKWLLFLSCSQWQVLLFLKPELWFGPTYFSAVSKFFFPHQASNFHLKIDEWGYPTSLPAQTLSAAAGLMQEGLSPSLSWGVGQGSRHTGRHRNSCIWPPAAEFAARRLVLDRLGDAEVCRAPFKTDGVLRGPWAQPWPWSSPGSPCSLPLTWPTLFIFLFKKC